MFTVHRGNPSASSGSAPSLRGKYVHMSDAQESTTAHSDDDEVARPDPTGTDPADTDHPAGERQAAENADNEPVA